MTGFGKAVAEIPGKKISVELKSLNSKQVDMSARVPSSLRAMELEMRNLVAGALERGKIELTVSVESVMSESTVELNRDVLSLYKKDVEETAKFLGVEPPQDWFSVLMRFPEVIKSESQKDPDDEELNTVRETVVRAIEALKEFRRSEGEKLEEFFAVRIQKIRTLLEEVPKYEEERIARIRIRMEEGLAKIHGVDYDRSRLEQELFFYIEKLDVNEEKQRLEQHLNYFMETLTAPKSQGKKLGFIAQEMGREINTLGSKSNHADMQKLVVEMKDILEQIKEQVLNVL